MVYGGQVPTFEKFSKYLSVVQVESLVAASVIPGNRNDIRQSHEIITETKFKCHVDGSWIN